MLTVGLAQARLDGLGVWFSLRVREVPGSIPGQAHGFALFVHWNCMLLKNVKKKKVWSRRDLNPRPSKCESDALPTELRPLVTIVGTGLNLRLFFQWSQWIVDRKKIRLSFILSIIQSCSCSYIWLCGATVARLTPDQKAACSNHVRVNRFVFAVFVKHNSDLSIQLNSTHPCTCFGSTYTKIGTIQRRLAWPLRKDDTQNREAFHIFCVRITPYKYFFTTVLSLKKRQLKKN